MSLPVAGAAVRLTVPDTVARGAKVPMMIVVSNTTSAPIELYLRGRDITFDILIVDSTGSVVWRRLEGEVMPAIVQLRTLGAKEVLKLRHIWDQKTTRGDRAAAGVYDVRSTILTDGGNSLVSNQAKLLIKP